MKCNSGVAVTVACNDVGIITAGNVQIPPGFTLWSSADHPGHRRRRLTPPLTKARVERYHGDVPYRQGRTRPWHGPGHFDDPFMMPDPSPIGEGPSQRRAALIALTIIGAAIVALVLVTVPA